MTEEANELNILPAFEANARGRSHGLQLTDEVLDRLADISLSNVELFYFDNGQGKAAECKVLPGDRQYPGKIAWKIFDLLTGGALIETVPLGSACYEGQFYNEEKCEYLLDNWNVSDTQYALLALQKKSRTNYVVYLTPHQSCRPFSSAPAASPKAQHAARTVPLEGFLPIPSR